LDGKGKIVGLKEKGLAKKDETGFVLEPAWVLKIYLPFLSCWVF
jgi:hypothetical protein